MMAYGVGSLQNAVRSIVFLVPLCCILVNQYINPRICQRSSKISCYILIIWSLAPLNVSNIFCSHLYVSSVLCTELPLTLFLFLTVLDCGEPPSVVNGGITFTSTTVGSLASYTCQGESQQGDTVLECLENGVWSGAPPLCPSEYESERLDKKLYVATTFMASKYWS